MSKKLDIVYFGDTKDINGVNLVTNLLLQGKEVFGKNKIRLSKIYAANGIINCDLENSLPIGANLGTAKYKLTRFIRTVLRIIMDSRVPFFAWYKFKKNVFKPAKNVISKNYSEFDNDYILFQDIFTAYFYHKRFNSKGKNTMLVLHCEKDILGQFKLLYPGIFNSRYKNQIDEILNYTLASVSKVIFVSKKSATFNKSTEYDTDFVHNGIPDLVNFNLKPVQKDMINFVCVGSINYNKGQDVIIEAINFLSSDLRERCKFYFIGDGPQLPELKRTVNNYKLNDIIFFLGLRKDVPDLLKNMDVLLLLSKTEGLPLSIIEGLRQGLYVISTDVGGVSEMIGDEFGKLVERDPKILCDVIVDVLNEEVITEESKQLARAHFLTHFTLDSMITKYSKLFNSIDDNEN